MSHPAARIALLLTPLLLLGACGSLGQQRSAQLLNDRLQRRLGPDIAAGQAVLQPVTNGARVTLLNPTLFPNDKTALDDRYPDARADVIEAMLNPRMMRVQVADTSTLPAWDRTTRVRNVEQYFVANGLGQTLLPAETAVAETAAAPPGLNITIGVQCPPRNDETSFDRSPSQPVCE